MVNRIEGNYPSMPFAWVANPHDNGFDIDASDEAKRWYWNAGGKYHTPCIAFESEEMRDRAMRLLQTLVAEWSVEACDGTIRMQRGRGKSDVLLPCTKPRDHEGPCEMTDLLFGKGGQ